MTEEKWQLYSQTGVDGPEYGVRIRPGYIVVGFQKEDAEQIIGLQTEVERLRSENRELEAENKIIADRAAHNAKQDAARAELQAARIKELEAEAQGYHDQKETALTLLSQRNQYTMRLEAAFLEAQTDRLAMHYAPHELTMPSKPLHEIAQEARTALEAIKGGP